MNNGNCLKTDEMSQRNWQAAMEECLPWKAARSTQRNRN